MREVSSGADASPPDDPHAAAFPGEDSMCPNLDAEAKSPQPSSLSGGGGVYVRYAPGGDRRKSKLVNTWGDGWRAIKMYEDNRHYFDGDQADEDRADPAPSPKS